jgi:hypothetical protein
MKMLPTILAVLATLFLVLGIYINMRLRPYIVSGDAFDANKQWRNPALKAAYNMKMASFGLALVFAGVSGYLFYTRA